MKRSSISSLLAAALALGALGFGTPAAGAALAPASKPAPITFTGKMTCDLAGKISLSPAFTTAGTNEKATMTLKGKLTECGGKKGFTEHKVTITGATLIAKSSLSDNSCLGLASAPSLPKLSGTIDFTTKGGTATATTFSFSDGTFAAGPPITVAYPGTSGTVKAKGSFAGTKGSASAQVTQTLTDLLTSCEGSSGLSTFSLQSGKATLG